MHSILINLKREPSRRRFALNELARASLSPDVLDATDASLLNAEEIARISTPNIRARLEDLSYRSMNKGALACSDSHRRAWAQLLEKDVWPALIFEDDIFWLRNAKSIKKHLKLIEHGGYDIVLLGYAPRHPFTFGAEASAMEGVNSYLVPYSSVGRTSGAYAYLLTKKAARFFWQMQENGIEREADDFAREHSRLPDGLNMGFVFPPIAHSGFFESTIWDANGMSIKVFFQRAMAFLYTNFTIVRPVISRAYLKRLSGRYLKGISR